MSKKTLSLALALLAAGCSKVYSPMGSTPVPASLPSNPGLVDDFESFTQINHYGLVNATATDTISYKPPTDPGPSTMTLSNTPGNTLPGGTPGNALRMTGVVQQNINWPDGGYPFAFVQMNMEGTGAGVDITSWAPKRQLVFAYKASALDLGQAHRVTLVNTNDDQHPGPPYENNYEYYIDIFTPATTNWTWFTVNFPPQAYWSNPCLGPNAAGGVQPNYFWPAIFYGACTATPQLPAWVPWNYARTHAWQLLFQPFSNNLSAFPYDFSIDDVRWQ